MIAPPASLIEKDKTTLNALHPEVVIYFTYCSPITTVVFIVVVVFVLADTRDSTNPSHCSNLSITLRRDPLNPDLRI